MCHYVSFSFIILTRGSNSREFIADCLNKQYQYGSRMERSSGLGSVISKQH